MLLSALPLTMGIQLKVYRNLFSPVPPTGV